jgi:hypothetical protein
MTHISIEGFIEESIQRWAEHGFHHTVFIQMREAFGTVRAMQTLVEEPDFQSGLAKLATIGLVDRSLEAAVLKFPGEFSPANVAHARDRIDGIPKCG